MSVLMWTKPRKERSGNPSRTGAGSPEERPRNAPMPSRAGGDRTPMLPREQGSRNALITTRPEKGRLKKDDVAILKKASLRRWAVRFSSTLFGRGR